MLKNTNKDLTILISRDTEIEKITRPTESVFVKFNVKSPIAADVLAQAWVSQKEFEANLDPKVKCEDRYGAREIFLGEFAINSASTSLQSDIEDQVLALPRFAGFKKVN